MTIILRAFGDADAAGVLAVHTAAIFGTSDEFYSRAERESWAYGLVAENYARVRDAGETFTVATTPCGQIVGFCSWTRERIAGLYIHPSHQRQGIGRQLLDHGEAALRINQVAISHIHASLSAVAFYQSHGYAVTRHGTHCSRGGLMMADAHLEKPLAKE